MAKSVHDDVLDGALSVIRTNATTYHICSAEPTSRATAISLSLGNAAVTSTDFTLAAGDVSGRKVTVAQKTGTVSANGTATHAAIIDGTRLLLVTTVTSQSLTTGNPLTLPAFDYELRDPT